VCRPTHVEQLRNGGINSTIRLHLVGSFYEFYITMHGSMNIKCSTLQMLHTYAAFPVLAGYETLVAHTVIWAISVNTTPILTDALLLALITILTFMSFYTACLSLGTLTVKGTQRVHTLATLTQAWDCFTFINICGHRDNAIDPLKNSSTVTSKKQLYVWMQYVKVWEKILPCTSTEIYPVLLLWKENVQEI